MTPAYGSQRRPGSCSPRAVPFGRKTALALDRYLRVRAGHPFAHLPNLWLGRPGAFGTVPGDSGPRRGGRATAAAPTSVPPLLRRLLAVCRRQRGRPDAPGRLETPPGRELSTLVRSGGRSRTSRRTCAARRPPASASLRGPEHGSARHEGRVQDDCIDKRVEGRLDRSHDVPYEQRMAYTPRWRRVLDYVLSIGSYPGEPDTRAGGQAGRGRRPRRRHAAHDPDRVG
jgi:hypothetical protein